MFSKKAFTLIELIVVIGIIGVLATLSMGSYANVQRGARDAKRKSDLKDIELALQQYYSDNSQFPPAGGCDYGTNCYVYSTAGASWIPALVSRYLDTVPVDPKNTAAGPWKTGNYSYAYGNVSSDGQSYDLTTQLENTIDKDRCELKNYRFYFDNRAWCTAFGGAYSNYIFERSPLTK